jgi:hypothetical protein
LNQAIKTEKGIERNGDSSSVRRKNLDACRHGVIHVIPAIPVCPVRPADSTDQRNTF